MATRYRNNSRVLALLAWLTSILTSPDRQVLVHPIGNSAPQISSSVRAILVQSLCFAAVLILTATPLYAIDQESIRSSVFALSSARQTAIHELEEANLSASEVTDYRDFIVYLNTRIINYCQELAEDGGLAALEGLPCPTGTSTSGAETTPASSGGAVFYTTGSGESAQTQAEKSAELDGGFLSTLGEFDEMLLKEEGKLATRVPSQRESATASSSGGTGSEGEGSDGEGGETGSGEVDGEGEQGEGFEGEVVGEGQEGRSGTESGTQSSTGAGNADVDHSVYGAPGGKLPPPEDDDIVARQLREAAEKEPDPELKKKLWEEYWKYKGVSN